MKQKIIIVCELDQIRDHIMISFFLSRASRLSWSPINNEFIHEVNVMGDDEILEKIKQKKQEGLDKVKERLTRKHLKELVKQQSETVEVEIEEN